MFSDKIYLLSMYFTFVFLYVCFTNIANSGLSVPPQTIAQQKNPQSLECRKVHGVQISFTLCDFRQITLNFSFLAFIRRKAYPFCPAVGLRTVGLELSVCGSWDAEGTEFTVTTSLLSAKSTYNDQVGHILSLLHTCILGVP